MDLTTFFRENSKAAVAFSGGVDSSYLLYAGISAGADVTGYYVKAAFQPMFEYNDAMRLAEQIGARVKVIEVDVLADEKVRQNPSNRCYYCKQLKVLQLLFKCLKPFFSDIVGHAFG